MSSRNSVLHHGAHFVMNPANMITAARIAASPLLFIAILSNEASNGTSWLAFALCWIFGAIDYIDGELARRYDLVSRSGAFLDPLADKVVVIGSMVSLFIVGRYHWVPVALIVVRELGITAFRSYWVRKGRVVPARTLGKWKSLFQGLAIVAAVFPTWQNQNLVVNALLWFAVAFTLYSGLLYLLDGSAATRSSGNLNETP